jgi:hypothetical protein
MPGRDQEPSIQLASGTTDERDGSYNISNTLGSIFYNTDTSNVEVYHEDPSNNVGWRDLVMNNKEQIDISGNVDISGNLGVSGIVTFADGTTMTTATTDNETQISNGTSKMEIDTAGECVFTPNGLTSKTTTFAADGTITIKGDIKMAENTDKTAILGKAKIGWGGYANYAAFSHYNKGSAGNYALLQSSGGTTFLNCSLNNLIYFRVNNNTKMTLAANGYFGIGRAPSFPLDVNGVVFFRTKAFATHWYTHSDDRMKENEKLIVNATETLSKLTPQNYDKYFNMDLSGSSQVESGLIAQEVYYNAPELRHLVTLGTELDASGNKYTPTPEEMDLSGVDIGSDPDYGSHGWSKTENSSLNYQGLIAYLIKSNQELVGRIDSLKTDISAIMTHLDL